MAGDDIHLCVGVNQLWHAEHVYDINSLSRLKLSGRREATTLLSRTFASYSWKKVFFS